MQFHANQENENWQHEVQLFVDFGEDITLTAGYFKYHAQIDQRLDFWSTGFDRCTDAVDYGVGIDDPQTAWFTAQAVYGAGALGTNPVVPASPVNVDWNSARDVGCGIVDLVGLVPALSFSDPHVTSDWFLEGPWTGDVGNSVPSGPVTDGTSTSVRNAPEAINQGFEVEVLWLPSDRLTLGGNYSYTSAEYSMELVDPLGNRGIIDENNPFAPPSLFTDSENRVLIDGLQLNRVPENKFSGWASYTWPLSNGKLDLLTSISWTDEVAFDESNSPLDVAADWYRWDARATWTSDDEKLVIAAFINNITD